MSVPDAAKGKPKPKTRVWKPRTHRVDVGPSIAEDMKKTAVADWLCEKVNDLEMRYAELLDKVDVATQALDYAHAMLDRISASTGAFVRNMDKVPDGTPIEAVRKPMMPAFATLDKWARDALSDVDDARDWVLLAPRILVGDNGSASREEPTPMKDRTVPPRVRPS